MKKQWRNRMLRQRLLDRQHLRIVRALLRPAICEECGKYPADPPSKLCPGCEAYREHTGAT